MPVACCAISVSAMGEAPTPRSRGKGDRRRYKSGKLCMDVEASLRSMEREMQKLKEGRKRDRTRLKAAALKEKSKALAEERRRAQCMRRATGEEDQ